ncbi:MAG: hypothetical protein KA419_06125 [Acidobacteria bacterium]|nr:hypothetical protein [Acidobacteriota bacterium]
MPPGMKLADSFREDARGGKAPVVPFFPFPTGDPSPLFDRVVALCETRPTTALGLVFPGRRVLDGVSGRRPAGRPVLEWDLFQFLFALKQRTGMPTVLAVHYRDILDFGIYPYAQEGHKVGLDLLLVRDPILDELDYFTAEVVAGGIGFGVVAGAGFTADAAGRARPYLSGPVCFPDGITPPGPARLFSETTLPALFRAPPCPGRPGSGPLPCLPREASDRAGWYLEVPALRPGLGPAGTRAWSERLDAAVRGLREAGRG